jgi:hypothetical protein
VVVDCAIALVSARPLTAATAIMCLSMFNLLWGDWCKGFSGRQRKAGVLHGERGKRVRVPGSRHIRAAFSGGFFAQR